MDSLTVKYEVNYLRLEENSILTRNAVGLLSCCWAQSGSTSKARAWQCSFSHSNLLTKHILTVHVGIKQ